MPFYVGDYLADTMHLTTTQHGAYLLLLMAYWKRQEPIPDDNATIAQITRMSLNEVEASRLVIGKFFKIADGKWTHSRMERDLEKHKKKYLAQSQAATKTNTKRYSSLSVSLSAPLTASQPEPEPEPNTNTYNIKEDVAKRLANRFIKPSIETCKLQAAKIGLPDQEGEMFWHYYESNGWRVGKNPMKSWTSAMANWKKNFDSQIYQSGGPKKAIPQPKTIEQTLSEERARDTRKLLKELEL